MTEAEVRYLTTPSRSTSKKVGIGIASGLFLAGLALVVSDKVSAILPWKNNDDAQD